MTFGVGTLITLAAATGGTAAGGAVTLLAEAATDPGGGFGPGTFANLGVTGILAGIVYTSSRTVYAGLRSDLAEARAELKEARAGCDAFQACAGRADFDELREDLRRGITWFDGFAEMQAHVAGKDWSLDYTNAKTAEEFVAAVAVLEEPAS